MSDRNTQASPTSSAVCVEEVTPWNGKLENRFVFLTLCLMFSLAVILLHWLYPSKNTERVKIPNEIRQQLTSLSNAAEEILLLKELEGTQPSLQSLQDMGIAPFSQIQLASMAELEWFQKPNCFIGFGQLNKDDNQFPEKYFQLQLSFKQSPANLTSATHGHDHNQASSTEQSVQPYYTSWRFLESTEFKSVFENTANSECHSQSDAEPWHVFSLMTEQH
ncbi:hypothetical protein ACFOEK_02005 [Litoribrevibacter euphylliae]|uniref:Uncharacterized protein n=1 Tax=Litoribrevibacter euphylliae TaxID=1834034 RepID=A0ABV7H799_9GAMM